MTNAGEFLAVMPDGYMRTMMMMDSKMSAEMMKMDKPLGHYVMMISESKGMMFKVDTSSAKGSSVNNRIAIRERATG